VTRLAIAWALLVMGCGQGEAGGGEIETEIDAASEVDTATDGDVGPDAETREVEGEVEVDPDAGPTTGWALVVASYERLETVAGRGAQRDEGNEWRAEYEGGPATAAELSRPHIAMADGEGRIFIADKEAHAVRRVDVDGRIHTVAGTGLAGDDGDAPGPGAARRLSDPNGLYVLGSDVVHVLDTGNGKVRRLSPDGTLTTFITVPGGIATGRGLWVAEDESSAFIASGDRVLRWDGGGVRVYAAGFSDLGNLVVAPDGDLIVTDRGAHRVYRVDAAGQRTPIAGNGTTSGGGDGASALASGLEEPRAVWFLPEDVGGGYLVGTHEGNQVWYVDPQSVLHLFLDGGDGHAHSGDGQHFRTPGEKVSEVRAITVTPNGDVLVTENDYGYVRRVLRRR